MKKIDIEKEKIVKINFHINSNKWFTDSFIEIVDNENENIKYKIPDTFIKNELEEYKKYKHIELNFLYNNKYIKEKIFKIILNNI